MRMTLFVQSKFGFNIHIIRLQQQQVKRMKKGEYGKVSNNCIWTSWVKNRATRLFDTLEHFKSNTFCLKKWKDLKSNIHESKARGFGRQMIEARQQRRERERMKKKELCHFDFWKWFSDSNCFERIKRKE